MRRIFEVTGIDKVAPIYASPDAAQSGRSVTHRPAEMRLALIAKASGDPRKPGAQSPITGRCR
jgi:hypothetical protein